jgi:hypothetical protein
MREIKEVQEDSFGDKAREVERKKTTKPRNMIGYPRLGAE